jgi:diguanylate cyclase (GGDEF)-like protein
LRFLLTANRIVHEVTDAVVSDAEFAVVGRLLCNLGREVLGAETVDFWSTAGDSVLRFVESDGFAGEALEPPPEVVDGLAGRRSDVGPNVVLPLVSQSTGAIDGVAVIVFEAVPNLGRPILAMLDQIGGIVEASLEREVLRRLAEFDRVALYEQAIHDPLTGLYNRVYLADAARRLTAMHDRPGSAALGALMVDIDHFKKVNDTYGHLTGDNVLRRVARAINAAVRPGDLAIRFGGEEFLVLLSGVDRDQSLAIGERLRAAAAEVGDDGPAVTISIGLALRHHGEPFDIVVKRADEALYQAKAEGRDRVQVAS